MNPSIQLNNLGKKFGKEWIFKNINFEIKAQEKLVILGGNGSGKSTLLQIISGFISPNKGDVNYLNEEKKIEPQNFKNYISLAAPYLQLIEDFTLAETIEHLFQFKKFQNNFSSEKIIELLQLENAQNKYVKQFSSGMKQRLRLGLAILANTPILLLDEPCSNLDKNAINWYKQMLQDFATHKTIIVCSNSVEEEFEFCDRTLEVGDYK